MTLEDAFTALIDTIQGVAKEAMIPDSETSQLEQAKDDVDNADDDDGGRIMMKNAGSGAQWLHRGKGDQNYVTKGGIMISGTSSGDFNFAPRAPKQGSDSKHSSDTE